MFMTSGPPSDQQINVGAIRAPRVSLLDISKTFVDDGDGEEVVAVDGVSFDVHDAELVTIVGPSGCGKSTVLNVIAGLEQQTAGRIIIDGEEIADRRTNFGYMFQKDLLFPWRTIRSNVAVGLEVLGVPKKDARAQAQAILDRFELGRFANKYPVQLSGGMRQRVALMRTLLCEREILLLDEPFGALDALTRSIMQEWLLGIWENDHRTIIFITHDIEEAIFLSDRVLMMSARPGIIKDEIKIDLERPRDHRIVTSPRFTELKKVILDQIYEESLKADRPD
jgi:ABC-type nitrate/sulfonate/bicarbonate transport system ATPase subunit